MSVYFTSDEHFGHANIIKFCNRPFTGVDDMQEKLIENHNNVVKAGDRVYHLGDMFWRTTSDAQAISILSRLNGQHYYILGNHEEVINRNSSLRNAFIWVKDTFNLKISGLPNIWLSHYAHRVWNGSHRWAYHLYGHTHAALPEDGSLSIDVGVDARNFYPISIDEVVTIMEAKNGLIQFKQWVCPKDDCKNSFKATNLTQAICSKCLTPMELK